MWWVALLACRDVGLDELRSPWIQVALDRDRKGLTLAIGGIDPPASAGCPTLDLAARLNGFPIERLSRGGYTEKQGVGGVVEAGCAGPTFTSPIDVARAPYALTLSDGDTTWDLTIPHLDYARSLTVEALAPGRATLRWQVRPGEVVVPPAAIHVTSGVPVADPACPSGAAAFTVDGDAITVDWAPSPTCEDPLQLLVVWPKDLAAVPSLAIAGCPPGGRCFVGRASPPTEVRLDASRSQPRSPDVPL